MSDDWKVNAEKARRVRRVRLVRIVRNELERITVYNNDRYSN